MVFRHGLVNYPQHISLPLARACQHNVAGNAILPNLFGVAGGAAVGAINRQTLDRLSGAPNGINIGRIENGRLFCTAELEFRREHKTAPGTAQGDKHREKNPKAAFHTFTSPWPRRLVASKLGEDGSEAKADDFSSGAVTTANSFLTSDFSQTNVIAKMFRANSKLPNRINSRPMVLNRKKNSVAFVASRKAMLGLFSFIPCSTPPMASGTMNSNTPNIESQNCRRASFGNGSSNPTVRGSR